MGNTHKRDFLPGRPKEVVQTLKDLELKDAKVAALLGRHVDKETGLPIKPKSKMQNNPNPLSPTKGVSDKDAEIHEINLLKGVPPEDR